MDTIAMLVRQTEDAYQWTNKLLASIPHDKWDITPESIESNISWQAGHLIMSFYFHSVMVIAGHQKDIFQQVPLKEYDQLFTRGSPRLVVGKTNPQELQDRLLIVEQKSISIIQQLSPEELEKPLEPTKIPHPIAKTKFEALDWNIKHTLWHCGQIALLKRAIHERYNFGLQRPEQAG